MFSGWGFSDLGQVQGQDQRQGQGQDHLLLQRAALPPFLVLALTLVLALVRNIIIFSKVRVLVLNQPIIPPGAWGGLQTVQEAQKKQPPGPKFQ